MKSFEWIRPERLEDALAELPRGVPKAGGVDLLDLMKEGLAEPGRLVDVKRLPELQRIESTKGAVSVGAAVTLAEIAEHPVLKSRELRALSEAAAHAATPQIRNLATLGGNLMQRPRCQYFRSADFPCRKKGGDTCYARVGRNDEHAIFENERCAMVHASSLATALTALGAEVELVSKKGTRRVALDSFFVPAEKNIDQETVVRNDELITRVWLETQGPEQARSAYDKLTHKQSFDWPLVEVAARATGSGDVRIVLGGVADRPWRAREAEKELQGGLTEARIAAAAARAADGATPLSDNGYKVQLVKTAVGRLLRRLVEA